MNASAILKNSQKVSIFKSFYIRLSHPKKKENKAQATNSHGQL